MIKMCKYIKTTTKKFPVKLSVIFVSFTKSVRRKEDKKLSRKKFEFSFILSNRERNEAFFVVADCDLYCCLSSTGSTYLLL